MVKTASAGGCPFACGGGMPVKPFTLMGEGMLVTVGALMPGGVLPPAAMRQIYRDSENPTVYFCNTHIKKRRRKKRNIFSRVATS